MLARVEWGTKHICPECASRYYDLKQSSFVCPSCGADPAAARLPSGGRSFRAGRAAFRRRAAEDTRPAVQKAEPETREDEDLVADEADEEEVEEEEADGEEARDPEDLDETETA